MGKIDPQGHKPGGLIDAERNWRDVPEIITAAARFLAYSPDAGPQVISSMVKFMYVAREARYPIGGDAWTLLLHATQGALARHNEERRMYGNSPEFPATNTAAYQVVAVMGRLLGEKGSFCPSAPRVTR